MKYESELPRLYAAAGREIRSLLREIDINTFNEAKALRIQARARRITLALNLAAKRWTTKAMGEAYSQAARKARVGLEILGKKRGRKPARRASQQAVLETLVKANASIRRTVERYAQAALLAGQALKQAPIQEFEEMEAGDVYARMAREAYVKEQSRGKLKKTILDHLGEMIGEDNLIEVGGKMWSVSKYAELVARTSLRQAQTDATRATCAEYENDLVIVLGHGDTDCDICQEYENKIFSLSGADQEYPELDEEPPFHPNCVHSIHPTSHEAIGVQEAWND